MAANPVHLLCNHLTNPLGIGSEKPRLSWQSDSTERDWHQSAYRILVASSADSLKQGKGDVWDSGKIDAAQSVGIAYGGPALESRKRYFWTVEVWDAGGHKSAFAPAAWFETGLLAPSDWQAKWITRTNPEDAADHAAMLWLTSPQKAVFRKQFTLTALPKSAALFTIAHGDFSVLVNGKEVTEKSRWTDFDRKDVTKELIEGENTIELRLAPGEGTADSLQIAALLKMTAADGTLSRIGTDASWQPNATVAGEVTNPLPQAAALFRREFKTDGEIASARLYITALGSYRVSINGQPPDKNVLTPDFTDYRKRLDYQTYDVTGLLKNGENAIGLVLGDGWYSSPLTWTAVHLYPPPNRAWAQLEIHYSNGTSSMVVTDEDWRTAASPIVFSQIYAGEDYDARNQQPGWNLVQFDDSSWAHAALGDAPAIQMTGLMTPPAHVERQMKAETVKPSANGTYVFDFGQNMVGWAQLKVHGPAGTRIRMRFAEILNPDGTIYTKNLRNADATDTYTLSGKGEETYSPSFTFHGFRYAEISGYPGTPTLETVTGQVVNSLEEPPTGQLKTSSELVNQMWEIGLWGQRGNFLSIPTDCPQRDERLGWMGDAGVFWRTGAYNFDISAFTRLFLLDVDDAQTPQGDFANVSPDVLNAENPGGEGAPGWSDAGVIVPYTAWLQYGDTSYIDDNWNAMQAFMHYILRENPDFIRKNGNGPNFADWLAPDPHSPNDLVATAYWALSARMMMQMAHATGREQDAEKYAGLINNIRAAYQKAFIKANGDVEGGTQTAYLLTLYTKMAPDALEKTMVDHLVSDIQARGGHLSTGFLGTPFLLFTLADHGRADIAYQLLLNTTYPSWGYMLSKGATTWWERWNGDSGDPAMNSFNHYAFGSVMAWVYRSVAGIDTAPDGAGFQHIVIAPQLGAGLTQASGQYDSAYGKITTDWKNEGGVFTLKVQIPANATATVHLPVMAGARMSEDGRRISTPVVEIGSGTYRFEVHSRL